MISTLVDPGTHFNPHRDCHGFWWSLMAAGVRPWRASLHLGVGSWCETLLPGCWQAFWYLHKIAWRKVMGWTGLNSIGFCGQAKATLWILMIPWAEVVVSNIFCLPPFVCHLQFLVNAIDESLIRQWPWILAMWQFAFGCQYGWFPVFSAIKHRLIRVDIISGNSGLTVVLALAAYPKDDPLRTKIFSSWHVEVHDFEL